MKKVRGYDGGRRRKKARQRKILLVVVCVLLIAVLAVLSVILWKVLAPVEIPTLPNR